MLKWNLLAVKAKNKKLAPQEMTGNTFTISNLGMFDIESLRLSSIHQMHAFWL